MCHPFASLPRLTLVLCVTVAAGGNASPAPNAATVFECHLEAVGGRTALAAVQSLRLKGNAQEGPHGFPFEFDFLAPGRFLLVAGDPKGFVVRTGRGLDGRCWRQDPKGIRELSDREAAHILELALAAYPPSLLELSRLLGEAPGVPGADPADPVFELNADGAVAGVPRLVFDARTGRLTRLGRVVLETYEAAGPIMLPRRLHDSGRFHLAVEGVELNPALEADQFERPAGGAAPTGEDIPAVPAQFTTRLSGSGQLEVVRHPSPMALSRGPLLGLPSADPRSRRPFQMDLRGHDLSGLELSGNLTNLLQADFDSQTRWPARLPEGFEPARVLELGQDPGLRVRELHQAGITGRGIGLGIIDQPLLVEHQEYRDRLRMYEEIHIPAGLPAQMHGPAVVSIAAGRSVGVAPECDVYYIAEQHGTFRHDGDGGFDWDFSPLAESIDRLLAVNATLPAQRRIRVISISVGWAPDQKGYAAAMAAVKRAGAAGVFVISTALEQTHGLAFHGLGREALADPNRFEAYGPGSWWAGLFWNGQKRFAPGQRLLVPMDCRGVAGPSGDRDYAFYASGGWSWSVPWIAGLYVLACQVQPDITPEVFWVKALETGRTLRLRHGVEEADFGSVADPLRLIQALQAPDASPSR